MKSIKSYTQNIKRKLRGYPAGVVAALALGAPVWMVAASSGIAISLPLIAGVALASGAVISLAMWKPHVSRHGGIKICPPQKFTVSPVLHPLELQVKLPAADFAKAVDKKVEAPAVKTAAPIPPAA